MHSYFTWSTTKEQSGFRFSVYQVTVLDAPNAKGLYAESKLVKTDVLPTRARATLKAKQWKRYLTAQAVKTTPALSPSTRDISTITEYGLTQKLSNAVRCF